uniref:Twin-arginine translocation signal domain-containing protein n=1 Tax=Thermorudis peleae TaxID=1382356 RepID=A0A831T8Q9_9BACT
MRGLHGFDLARIVNSPPSHGFSRRAFLKAVAGTGIVAASANLLPLTSLASTGSSVTEILTIAAIAERLAVTFYTHGIMNAARLRLNSRRMLDELKAFAIEEQIHHNFFVAAGADSATVEQFTEFSFPHGPSTFTDLRLFLETQQQLEGVFDAAFIAAVFEFADAGRPELARIAAMVAMIEEGHRAVGRRLGYERGLRDLAPAEEQAFAPQLIRSVSDAPQVVAEAGYLSAEPGNSFTYTPIDFEDPEYASVYARIEYTEPFVAS